MINNHKHGVHHMAVQDVPVGHQSYKLTGSLTKMTNFFPGGPSDELFH